MPVQSIILIAILAAFVALALTLFTVAWWSGRTPARKFAVRVEPARRPATGDALKRALQP